MANDAMLIAIDRIGFAFRHRRKMQLYAVGVAADNLGKVLVTEPPATVTIRHNPSQGRPAVWDFGGDGYPIYQRTGGLPDIVAAHLLIIRDRSGARRAGDVIRAVGDSEDARGVIGEVSAQVGTLGKGGLAAASAMSLLLPIARVIAHVVDGMRDRVLQTLSGALYLDAERRRRDDMSQVVVSPDRNIEVEADVFLFDGEADADSTADTARAETRLRAEGLLLTESDT